MFPVTRTLTNVTFTHRVATQRQKIRPTSREYFPPQRACTAAATTNPGPASAQKVSRGVCCRSATFRKGLRNDYGGWAKEGGVFLCVLSYAFHRFPFPLGPVGASFRSVRRKMQANPSGFWLKFNGYLWVEYFYSTRGSASPGLCLPGARPFCAAGKWRKMFK